MYLTAMQWVQPVVLNHRGVRLEPLGPQHEAGLRRAAADGELWRCGNALRRDGTVRDTVMYSLTAAEWPDVKRQLQAWLA